MNGSYNDPDELLLRAIAAQALEIEAVERQEQMLRFRGRLRLEAEAAYALVAPPFQAVGKLPLLQEDGAGVSLLVVPALPAPAPSRLWLALLLFAITIASTIYVGAQDLDLATGLPLWSWVDGLSFSAALLGILLAHELGHYIVARREGVAVSYPFFIPMPLFLLGTMGAVIAIKEPVPSRRALLAIGIAGPLAGLAVALPVLLLGLSLSEVRNIDALRQALPDIGYFTEGNSLIYAGMKMLVFGRMLPAGPEDVFLHPVALAGWAGLLVTGLNLLPAGQLDGGHVFFALFGPRAAQIMSMIVAVALLGLGFLSWSGWFLWAVIVALMGQRHSPLLNEVTPLRGGWRLLAVLGLLVFALVFTPAPITILP